MPALSPSDVRDLTPDVPNARPGPVSDEALLRYAELARAFRDGTVTPDEAFCLVQVMPELLQELVQRRQAMALIGRVSDIDNVIFLPPGRG